MKMDRFTSDLCEVKFANGAQDGTFSGYGSIFGNVDSHGDVIEKGAFKESLRAWEAKGKLPPMLLQHGGFFGPVDDMLPIGKWTSMEENSKGLKVEGQLFALGTDRGQLIYEGMKAGSLDGLSIGYRAKKYTVGTKPTDPSRTLHEIDLVELSVVTFPSNDKATVGAVKSADIDALKSLSDFEDFLREAGGPRWTKNTARDFVGRLTKIARREAGGDLDVAGLLEGLRSTRKLISPNQA
ncbi:MAG: HK97 family phage prohead protease [Mesorhizobium sp.]|nr:MAG: HK97 family phage prohead protease [Mesorhizobium sp.]